MQGYLHRMFQFCVAYIHNIVGFADFIYLLQRHGIMFFFFFFFFFFLFIIIGVAPVLPDKVHRNI